MAQSYARETTATRRKSGDDQLKHYPHPKQRGEKYKDRNSMPEHARFGDRIVQPR